MSTSDPKMSDEHWGQLALRGYVVSTVKGNPYERHAREEGKAAALCGKAPGESPNTHRMKKRTGWGYYPNPTTQRPDCPKCLAKAAELLAPKSNWPFPRGGDK